MPCARASLWAAAALAACEVTVTDDDQDAGTGGTGGSGGTGGTGGSGGSDSTYFRLANLSPDSFAVDFCIAAHGSSSWGGPVIADVGSQVDADGSMGLSFGQVSIFMSVPEGTYDLRLVNAGVSNCDSPLITDTTLNTMYADEYRTIALIGDTEVAGNDSSLSIATYRDNASGVTGYSKLRFIHAAPGLGSLDFGFGSIANGDYKELYTSVAFGKAGSSSSYGTVDSYGYVITNALSDQLVSVHTAGASSDKIASTTGAVVGAAQLGTFLVIGGKTDDTDTPAHLMYCKDSVGIDGYLTGCYVISSF